MNSNNSNNFTGDGKNKREAKVKPAPAHVGPGSPDVDHEPRPQPGKSGRELKREDVKNAKESGAHKRGIKNLSGFTHGESDDK